jgi:tetratricopeptide (TPR) repeat protein
VRETDADELRRQMGSSASVVAEIITDVKDRLPEVQPPAQMDDPDSARFRLFDSIASFLKSASQAQPLVIVLDDLHWSDGPSLAFLEFMARELGQSRVLLICTYRDMELNRRHPLTVTLGDLARERLYERVLLQGLSEQDVARFIEIAAGRTPPAELSATVHRHTEGNPLFVTEVVRELVQSGELSDQRVSSTSTWSVLIPEGVREVIGRRLDRLSDHANEVLTVAAVVGRRFAFQALAAIVPDTTEDRLLDVLDEALAARVIEELPSSVGDYQFTHALIHETYTRELSAARRVRLHARIAEALELQYGATADDHATELAPHFAEAEPVLGSDRLFHYSKIAGDSALAAHGYEEAVVHFERALSAREEDQFDGDQASVCVGLSRAQGATGKVPEAADSLRLAVQFYLDSDEVEDAANALRDVHSVLLARRIVNIFPGVIDRISENSDQMGFILASYGFAVGSSSGDYATARSALERSLEIAEQRGVKTLKALVLANIANVEGFQLNWNAVAEYASEALKLLPRDDGSVTAFRATLWLGLAAASAGRVGEGLIHFDTVFQPAKRRHDKGWMMQAMSRKAGAYCAMGNWVEAEQADPEGLGQADEVGTIFQMAMLMMAMYTGDEGKTREAIDGMTGLRLIQTSVLMSRQWRSNTQLSENNLICQNTYRRPRRISVAFRRVMSLRTTPWERHKRRR